MQSGFVVKSLSLESAFWICNSKCLSSHIHTCLYSKHRGEALWEMESGVLVLHPSSVTYCAGMGRPHHF